MIPPIPSSSGEWFEDRPQIREALRDVKSAP